MAVFLASSMVPLRAQDLAPRAYVITPLHSNAITLTYGFYNGSLLLNGAVPVTGVTGTYSVPVFTYYHSFGLLGRSSNISASLPYAIGTFEGKVVDSETQIYRSGLAGHDVSSVSKPEGWPGDAGKRDAPVG